MAVPFNTRDLYALYSGDILGRTDDAGGHAALLSEEEFNALPEAERFNLAGNYSLGATNVYFDSDSGKYVGYGDPRFVEGGAERFVYDPSQIVRGENGRFEIDPANVNSDAMNDLQNETDRSGFFGGTGLQNLVRGAGIVLGGGLAANALGAGSAVAGATDIPVGGMLAESVAPQVTEVMAGSPFLEGAAGGVTGGMLTESVAPQVTETMVGSPWEIQPGYLPESTAPQVDEFMYEPMVETPPSAIPQVTETMSGSPFERNWLRDFIEAGRDALGGGGGEGGGNPVIAALMGGSGRIGEHKQDTDPYGLEASGYGPWKGLLDAPKQKVADAMMKRKKSIWS